MRATQPGRWLTLGQACQLLGVNESTLRHWADRGQVRTFRTLGGHRRLSREDLERLMESPAVHPAKPVAEWDQAALSRIRRQLHRHRDEQPWAERFDEQGRARMRLLGRQILGLVTDLLAHPRRRTELLQEASALGGEYGRETLRNRLELKRAVEALIFFRDSLVESTRRAAHPDGADLSPERAMKALHEVMALSDALLLGVVDSYATATAADG